MVYKMWQTACCCCGSAVLDLCASTLLHVFPCMFNSQVVALRSSQLKAEQAISDAAAAEAKLEEAGQQLAAVRVELTTETARAQQLAAQMGAAKEAEKEALAKLSAAQVALQDASQLAASRGSQVEALSAQLDALKASVATMSQGQQQGQQQPGADVSVQLAQRDATIKVRATAWSAGYTSSQGEQGAQGQTVGGDVSGQLAHRSAARQQAKSRFEYSP